MTTHNRGHPNHNGGILRVNSLIVGKRIKELREQKKMSLTELAAKAKIAKSYLSNIERQVQSNPSMLFLHKISHVLEVDVEALVGYGSAEDYPDEEWLELVKTAEKAGLKKDDFRAFIDFKRFARWHENGNEPLT